MQRQHAPRAYSRDHHRLRIKVVVQRCTTTAATIEHLINGGGRQRHERHGEWPDSVRNLRSETAAGIALRSHPLQK